MTLAYVRGDVRMPIPPYPGKSLDDPDWAEFSRVVERTTRQEAEELARRIAARGIIRKTWFATGGLIRRFWKWLW